MLLKKRIAAAVAIASMAASFTLASPMISAHALPAMGVTLTNIVNAYDVGDTPTRYKNITYGYLPFQQAVTTDGTGYHSSIPGGWVLGVTTAIDGIWGFVPGYEQWRPDFTPNPGASGLFLTTYMIWNPNNSADVVQGELRAIVRPVLSPMSFAVPQDSSPVTIDLNDLIGTGVSGTIIGTGPYVFVDCANAPNQGGTFVSVAGTGTMQYQPAAGYYGTETFTCSVVDESTYYYFADPDHAQDRYNLVQTQFTVTIRQVQPATYTINFLYNYGGSPAEPFDAAGGAVASGIHGIVSAAATPTRAGYVFAGWFLDSSATTPYSSTADLSVWAPNGTLNLYADWQSVGCHTRTHPPAKGTDHRAWNVRFFVDPTAAISTVQVPNGATVAKPTDPVLADSKFVNWSLDRTCTDKAKVYNFATPVTSNLNLYACFTSASETILAPSGGSVADDPARLVVLAGVLMLGGLATAAVVMRKRVMHY